VSRVRRSFGALGAALLAAALSSATALAASPTPGAGGDPRSAGEGPGLVGDPAFAVIAVVVIGLTTLLVTLGYIRLTGGRRP
jgi:hypothetical protein